MLIRHLVLSVRLLANMVAGHLVLAGILGLIVVAAETSSTGQWFIVTVIAVISSALFSVLELFVAFLQAYIFTFLSALFIGGDSQALSAQGCRDDGFTFLIRQVLEKESSSVNKYITFVALVMAVFFLAAAPAMAHSSRARADARLRQAIGVRRFP